MKFAACVLLLASTKTVDVVEETETLARGKRTGYSLSLRQDLATIEATWQVVSGSPALRLVLMTREDAERLNDNLPHGFLAVATPGRSGVLRYRVRRPDDYVL